MNYLILEIGQSFDRLYCLAQQALVFLEHHRYQRHLVGLLTQLLLLTLAGLEHHRYHLHQLLLLTLVGLELHHYHLHQLLHRFLWCH